MKFTITIERPSTYVSRMETAAISGVSYIRKSTPKATKKVFEVTKNVGSEIADTGEFIANLTCLGVKELVKKVRRDKK